MLKNNYLTQVIITLLLVSSSALTVRAQIGLPGGGIDPDLTGLADKHERTGYEHTGYYYMPDIGVYYDIAAHEYIYASNKEWVRGSSLPARYRQYDIDHSYKVVLNQPSPWLHNDELAVRYAQQKKRRRQAIHP